jgi:tRNA threonylcarbamoyladenosine biosynthesis protein TsaB
MILGIATASRSGGVCLLDPATSRFWATDLGAPTAHAENLLPAAAALLQEGGVGWDKLSLVAVDVGPGSFTGIRVGVAAALGLSEARGIPATGVGSLDILADACYHAIHPGTDGYMICAADVRRGEVVWAAYRPAPPGPRVDGPERLAAVAAPGTDPPPGTILVADHTGLLWPDRDDIVRWVPSGADRATATARIGRRMQHAGDVSPPVPRYARPADARPAVRALGSQAGGREDGATR